MEPQIAEVKDKKEVCYCQLYSCFIDSRVVTFDNGNAHCNGFHIEQFANNEPLKMVFSLSSTTKTEKTLKELLEQECHLQAIRKDRKYRSDI